MKTRKPRQRSVQARTRLKYVLRLYVTGATPRSSTAIANLRKLCEEYLVGRVKLQIVDIYQKPELAAKVGLVAAPTLIKSFPLPLRRFIGDMSNRQNLLAGLAIESVETAPKKTKRPGKG